MDKPFPVFAEALLDTQLLVIGRDVVFRLIDTDPSFSRRLLAGLSMRLHSLIADVESYSLRSSTQRVIGYLLQHHTREKDHGNQIEVTLPTTKHTLASRLNLTPETFSRILHDLSESGLIQVRGRHITVPDLQRLRKFDL